MAVIMVVSRRNSQSHACDWVTGPSFQKQEGSVPHLHQIRGRKIHPITDNLFDPGPKPVRFQILKHVHMGQNKSVLGKI